MDNDWRFLLDEVNTFCQRCYARGDFALAFYLLMELERITAKSDREIRAVDEKYADMELRRRLAARTAPRPGRIPHNIETELTELCASMDRPKAVKKLADRYHVTPGAINKAISRRK